MHPMRALLAALLVALALCATDAHARQTPSEKCAIAKNKAAAKKLANKMACHQKAIAKRAPVDAECLLKAEQKFAAALAKAEKKGGCVVIGDEQSIEGAVDDCVDVLVGLTPTCLQNGNGCSVASACCSGGCAPGTGGTQKCCTPSGQPCDIFDPGACCSLCCMTTGQPGSYVCCS